MISALLAIFFLSAPAPPAAAADSSFSHSTWTAGAVAGSTTTAGDDWTGYDSNDGNIVVLSTAFQSVSLRPGAWEQTDDGTGETGFNRSTTSLSFSSTVVSGIGASASVVLSTAETVSAGSASLLTGRARMGIAYHAGVNKFYLFGGVNADGTLSGEILEFDPVTQQLLTKSGSFSIPRAGVAAAYDAIAGKIYTFGGIVAGNSKVADIHAYNPFADTLDAEPGALPTARARMAAAYDSQTQKIYLFGGENFNGTKLDSILSYEGLISDLVTLSTPLAGARADAAAAYDATRKSILLFGGEDAAASGLDEIIEFAPNASTWTLRAAVLPSTRAQAGAAFNGVTGKTLVYGGSSETGITDQIIEYDPQSDAAVLRPTVLSSSRAYASAGFSPQTQRAYIFGGETVVNGGRSAQILEHLALTSGTFVSSVFDTGNRSDLGVLTYAPAAQFSPAVGLGLSARAGNTPAPDASWSNAGNFVPVPNGGSLAALGPAQYIQYRATFTTTDISTGAALAEVTVAYTQTAPSATLVSSAFDLGADLAVLRGLAWSGSFPSGTGAHLQLRSAPDAGGLPGAFGPWLGPTSAGDFYTDPGGSAAINPLHRDGVSDRFVQYRAILYSTATLSAPNISSISVNYNVLPASPTLDALTAISTDSIVLTTIDNAVTEDLIVVSTGFLPLPVNDGLEIPTLSKAGTGSVQVSTIAGFPPNTAVFVRARARNAVDGLDSFFSNELSRFTLANPPSNLEVPVVFQTSMTLNWDINSNTGATLYEISLSTDDFVLNFSTPIVFADGLTGNTTDLISLEGGTTYYIRVRAQNGNAVRTDFSAAIATATQVAPLTGLSGSGVGISSVVFSWNSSGPSAQYRVYAATAGVVLATVDTTSAAITGLSPNTTFAIQVEPFNSVSSAGLSLSATVYSLAAPPSQLEAVPLSTGSLSLSWDPSGNSAETPYEILYSTDAFQTTGSTAALFTDAFTGLSTTYAGLDAGTTYSFRLRAQNGDGINTAFVTASTQTVPGAVVDATGTALGVSSLSWTWSGGGPSVEFYRVIRGSSGVQLATTTGTAFLDTGLLPNTTYGLRVQAVNLSSAGALAAETTAHTAAQAPSATTLFAVFIDSITLAWDTGLNPAETVYSVERSTDNALFSVVAASAAAAADDINIPGNTTYYYRVRAFNGAGLASPYDATVSTFLAGVLPFPPGGFSAKSLTGGRIHLSWSISPSSTVVSYGVYFDSGTGTIDYSVLFASIAAPSTSYNTVPLSIGTSYFFGLRATNEKGEEEKNTHVVAAAAAAAVPGALVASIRSPPPGAIVSGNRIMLRAGLDEGTPAAVSQIRLEFRAVGAGAWIPVSAVEATHPNPAVESPYTTHWDASGLAPGIYELRAVARDAVGADDALPPSVRVRVDNAFPDISENRGAGTQAIKRVRVHRFIPTETDIVGGMGKSLLTVRLDSAAITAESDWLRIDTDPALKPEFSSSFSAAGIIREITLESGQTDFPAGRTASLVFSHLDNNGDNRVDGTEVRADNLRLAVYDASRAEWLLSIPSGVVNDPETTLAATTPHFSLFAVVSPAATGLDEIRIYPNPYRPNNSNDDDGKPWSSTDPTSGIIFDGLPASGEVRVYSVSGTLVWRSMGPVAGGLLRWDGKNGDGREVASGVYFAVFTDSAGRYRAGKVAIIR